MNQAPEGRSGGSGRHRLALSGRRRHLSVIMRLRLAQRFGRRELRDIHHA
jgi:hypothetical protein